LDAKGDFSFHRRLVPPPKEVWFNRGCGEVQPLKVRLYNTYRIHPRDVRCPGSPGLRPDPREGSQGSLIFAFQDARASGSAWQPRFPQFEFFVGARNLSRFVKNEKAILLLVLEPRYGKGYHPGHRYTQFVGAGSTLALNALAWRGRGARHKW
jgi:hypothetical protein